jgi:hypothetical protein
MGNSMQHYLGYGYGPAQRCASSRPPVVSWQRQGGEVHVLRVWNQAKQATHTKPLISIGLSEKRSFCNMGPQAGKQPRDPR